MLGNKLHNTIGKIILSAILCGSLMLGGTPKAEAGMISLNDEIEMGRSVGQALENQYGLSLDPVLQEKVERIGKRLAKVCGRDEVEFSFKVLNCDEVNALACPGGFVYVFKGLLDYMPSDAELAGVLGHEVGHVAKKHTVHALEKQMLTSIIGMAAAIGTGSPEGIQAVMMGQQALMSGFSRTDERGADKEGVTNCINAGFNPYSMLVTANKLNDLSQMGETPNYGVFSSHPEPEERIKRIKAQLAKYNIHPEVVVGEETASVVEEDWEFKITQSIGSTKAEYRAYLLAGALWTVRQKGNVQPHYFVVRDHGDKADIYYDDIQVFTVYPQDAFAAGYGSSGSYAGACVARLRDWIPYAITKAHKKK